MQSHDNHATNKRAPRRTASIHCPDQHHQQPAMNDIIRKLRRTLSPMTLIRLLIYPLTLLLLSPWRLLRTLWASGVLVNGKWSEYNRFRVKNGINSLFYWTQVEHLDRCGRFGISPTLGPGDYELSKWSHLTLLSTYAYRYAGAVLPLASMLGWWGSQFLWIGHAPAVVEWQLLALLLALLSTTFFAGAFAILNYNAMGWMFFPLALWGLMNDNLWVAALAWLGASFTSITVVTIGSALTLVFAIESLSFSAFATVIPAALKVASHFFMIKPGQRTFAGIVSNIIRIAAGVGLPGAQAKYKRKPIYGRINVLFLYFSLLYLQFGLSFWWLTGEQPWVWWGAMALYAINKIVARFADEQSLYMTLFSVATALTLANPDPLLLMAYWVAVSPIPRALGDGTRAESFDRPPPLRPYRVQPLLDRIDGFLSPLSERQRVLMAFNDPQGAYEKLFDGYRTILEAPLFVAARRNIHFLPDWWTVFDCNYEGAPNFWGRECGQVLDNVRYWSADYVVVYQVSGTELEKCWTEHGFGVAGQLDWSECAQELQHETPWVGPTPTWWLLKAPADLKAPGDA